MSEYILMNKDTPVLQFDLDGECIVLNNDMLPFSLRDADSKKEDTREERQFLGRLRDFFASRTISASRKNAPQILRSAGFDKWIKTQDKLSVSIACRAVSMQDSFWIKNVGETVAYQEVCLRNRLLEGVSYPIAIDGIEMAMPAFDLVSDLTTGGMYPKLWKKNADSVIQLWKTDSTSSFVNTVAELRISEALVNSNVNALVYEGIVKNARLFAVSDCLASDSVSLVAARQIVDWATHNQMPFEQIVRTFEVAFARMCLVDYVFANIDRHWENWFFVVDNKTNDILGIAPLFDHNQAMISDVFGSDTDEMMYDPTGLSFEKTIEAYAKVSGIKLSPSFPYTAKELVRVEKVNRICERNILSYERPYETVKITNEDGSALPPACEEILETSFIANDIERKVIRKRNEKMLCWIRA